MATHSSVLAWRFPGTEEPVGLPSVGSHRVRHDGLDLAAEAAATEGKLHPQTLRVSQSLHLSSPPGVPRTSAGSPFHGAQGPHLCLNRCCPDREPLLPQDSLAGVIIVFKAVSGK